MPRVALDPTIQNTGTEVTPAGTLIIVTTLDDAVVKVEPILKIQTLDGSLFQSNVNTAETAPIAAEEANPYTPPGKIKPPKSTPVKSLVTVLP